MGGHKEMVNSLSIHPSGRLALSVSRDKTLYMWNLVEGRPAYRSRLTEAADVVLWSPDGLWYAIAFPIKLFFLYTFAKKAHITVPPCVAWQLRHPISLGGAHV